MVVDYELLVKSYNFAAKVGINVIKCKSVCNKNY